MESESSIISITHANVQYDCLCQPMGLLENGERNYIGDLLRVVNSGINGSDQALSSTAMRTQYPSCTLFQSLKTEAHGSSG